MLESSVPDRPHTPEDAMPAYTLMLKNSPVMGLSIGEPALGASRVTALLDIEKAPLSIWNGRISRMRDVDFAALFNRWWAGRIIPSSRIGIRRGLRDAGAGTASELSLRSMGLSLSDQYWLKPASFDGAWEDVNFFENDFDDELGRILANAGACGQASPLSPSATVDGNLPKMWRVDDDGTRTLLKAGSGALKQEPFNEAAATVLHGKLLKTGDFVPYAIERDGWSWMSACPCMVDGSRAFVDARSVFYSIPENAGSLDKAGMLRACEALGIENPRTRIDQFLACDFLLGNVDRHPGNFGAIRNSDTGRFEGMAPIFDSGLSLLCLVEDAPQNAAELSANPFAPRQSTQLAMVEDFSWLDPAVLAGIPDEICSIVELCPSRYMDQERLEFIHAFVGANIEAVEAAANMEPCAGMSETLEKAAEISRIVSSRLEAEVGGSVFPIHGLDEGPCSARSGMPPAPARVPATPRSDKRPSPAANRPARGAKRRSLDMDGSSRARD